jgi:hypothetical protein
MLKLSQGLKNHENTFGWKLPVALKKGQICNFYAARLQLLFMLFTVLLEPN